MNLYTLAILLSGLLLIILIIILNKSKTRKLIIKLFNCIIVCQLIVNIFLILQILLADSLHIHPVYFEYFAYIGNVFLPVFLYLASQVFTKPQFKIKKYHSLLFVIPIISLIVLWTNDYHHMFFINYDTLLKNSIYGPYLYIHSLYTYFLIIISLVTLLKYSLKESHKVSVQTFLFLLAAAFPVGVNVIGLLGIANLSVYVTPIAFSISCIFLYIAIFKFDFLNINSIAAEFMMKAISDAYIILNNTNEITSCNKIFLNIFNLEENDILDKKIFEIKEIKDLFSKDDLEIAIELIKTTTNKIRLEKYFKKTDTYFSIDISSITKASLFSIPS